MELAEAIQAIIDNQENPTLNWAVNYAKYAAEMLRERHNKEHIRIQLIYLVGNISHWRGPLAQEVRKTIKASIKEME